jgi:hypothetical protein
MTMTTFHFQTHVSDSGVIMLPLDAKDFYGEIVSVNVDKGQSFDDDGQPDPAGILPNGKTPVEDFLDFCKELNMPSLTDEDVEQMKYEYLVESDDWQPDPAVVREFFESRISLDVELTDDEIETLKHERRMRRML